MTDGSVVWDNTPERPYASIQYKGTDLCADFYCKCGSQFHIDNNFVYTVQCLECKTVYAVNTFVKLHEIDEYDKEDVKTDPEQFDPEWIDYGPMP